MKKAQLSCCAIVLSISAGIPTALYYTSLPARYCLYVTSCTSCFR